MLTIRCTNDKAKTPNMFYTLVVGQKYTVGRRGGDISFPDDQSVSRNHAEITVEHPPANVSDPLLIPTVVLTDLGSKFGTFTNEGIERRAQISMREPMNLSPGDRFRFGLQWSEYKIEYTPLIVTPSTLKDQPKLKKIIMTLGGHMVNEWCDKCNYVVMDVLTLTVKAVCAILSAKPIVTPAFFDDLYECVKTKKGQPIASDFLPPFGEKTLKAEGLSLRPDERRTQLFEGKTFLFATQKHLKKLGVAVACGGGTSALVTSVSLRDVVKEGFLIVKPTQEYAMMDPQVKKIIEKYQEANKRLIQESEIGLAAVYISIETHCNPFGIFPENNPKLVSQTQASDTASTQNSARVTVPETQDIPSQNSTSSQSQSRNVVAESEPMVKQEPGSSSGSKRTANRTEEDVPSSKKRSADDSLIRNVSGNKRLRSADAVESQKALSALFGLSDSEEEEDEPIIVPETQNFVMGSLDIVPASLDFVPESPEVVPASPEVLSTSEHREELDESEVEMAEFKMPAQPQARRVTRSRGVVDVDESPAVPEQPTTSKRKLRSSSEESISPVPSPQTSKKRKTTASSYIVDENDELANKTEQLKIEIDPIKLENSETGNKVLRGNVSVVTRSLLQKSKAAPKIEIVDGRNVKNYKTFKKVLPLSQQRDNTASGKSSGSGNKCSGRKLTFEIYDYDVPQSNPSFGPGSLQPFRSSSIRINLDDEGIPTTFSRSASRRNRMANNDDPHPAAPPVSKANPPDLVQRSSADIPTVFPSAFEEENQEDDIWGFD